MLIQIITSNDQSSYGEIIHTQHSKNGRKGGAKGKMLNKTINSFVLNLGKLR